MMIDNSPNYSTTATYDNYPHPDYEPKPNRHERRKDAAIKRSKKYKDKAAAQVKQWKKEKGLL